MCATFCGGSMGRNWRNVPIEQPPNVEFGEYALPLAFKRAKKGATSAAEAATETIDLSQR